MLALLLFLGLALATVLLGFLAAVQVRLRLAKECHGFGRPHTDADKRM